MKRNLSEEVSFAVDDGVGCVKMYTHTCMPNASSNQTSVCRWPSLPYGLSVSQSKTFAWFYRSLQLTCFLSSYK